MITADMLDRRWPRAPHSLVDAIVGLAPAVLAKFGITTPLRVAHFLAHASVECAAGTALEENLNYSAERLHAVWPGRFPSIGSAQPFAHNPRLLADKVYDGRMGNRAGTDDGWNYRGRGLIDITGAAMYQRVGEAAGIDLKANPSFASAPETSLAAASALWMLSNANRFADRDEIRAETKVINGGLTGLAARGLAQGLETGARAMSGETVTQLVPPIDVRTPWGWATCFAWIHSGAENEPQWKCAIYDGERAGHVIDIPQKDIRFGRNYSVSRTETTLPPQAPEMMRMTRPTLDRPKLRVKLHAPQRPPKRSSRDRIGVTANSA